MRFLLVDDEDEIVLQYDSDAAEEFDSLDAAEAAAKKWAIEHPGRGVHIVQAVAECSAPVGEPQITRVTD